MSDRNHVVLSTASHDGTIRFWHAASGLCQRTIQNANEPQVNCLTTSHSKAFLAAAGHQNIRVFDTASLTSEPLFTYQGHTNNVTSLAYQREDRWFVSGSEDGTIKIWDSRAPGVQREISVRAPITSIALHPNQGELLGCDDDGSLRIWDLGMGATILECVPEDQASCRSVTISPDGSTVALGNNRGNCYIWKVAGTRATTLEPAHKLDASNSFLTKVLFSPDGEYLATCSADHTCKLWSAQSGAGGLEQAPQQQQQQFKNALNKDSMAAAPNTGVDGTGGTSTSYTLSCDLYDHHGWVWDCSFSADSNYLVTASSDRSAKLWDLSSSEVLLEYRGHHRGLTAITLNDT